MFYRSFQQVLFIFILDNIYSFISLYVYMLAERYLKLFSYVRVFRLAHLEFVLKCVNKIE